MTMKTDHVVGLIGTGPPPTGRTIQPDKRQLYGMMAPDKPKI